MLLCIVPIKEVEMKEKKKTVLLFAVVVSLVFIFGCATVKKDYRYAQQINSIEAYKKFLAKHSNSEYNKEVRERIEQLEKEEQQWKSAKSLNTIESYEQYLTSYLFGKFREEAKDAQESLLILQTIESRIKSGEEKAITEELKNKNININKRKRTINALTNTQEITAVSSILYNIITTVPPLIYSYEPRTTINMYHYDTGKGGSPYTGPSGSSSYSYGGSSYHYSNDELSLRKAAIRALWLIEPLRVSILYINLELNKAVVEEYKDAESNGLERYSGIVINMIIETSKELRSTVIAILIKKIQSVSSLDKALIALALSDIFNITTKDSESNIVFPILLQLLEDKSELVRDYAKIVLKEISGKDFGSDQNKWQKWWDELSK